MNAKLLRDLLLGAAFLLAADLLTASPKLEGDQACATAQPTAVGMYAFPSKALKP